MNSLFNAIDTLFETGEIYNTYEDFMNNYKEDENRFIFKIYATIL